MAASLEQKPEQNNGEEEGALAAYPGQRASEGAPRAQRLASFGQNSKPTHICPTGTGDVAGRAWGAAAFLLLSRGAGRSLEVGEGFSSGALVVGAFFFCGSFPLSDGASAPKAVVPGWLEGPEAVFGKCNQR